MFIFYLLPGTYYGPVPIVWSTPDADTEAVSRAVIGSRHDRRVRCYEHCRVVSLLHAITHCSPSGKAHGHCSVDSQSIVFIIN